MAQLYSFSIAELSVGQHWYWTIAGSQVHGQVLITTWFVFTVIRILSLTANRSLKETPDGLQNLLNLLQNSSVTLQKLKFLSIIT
jgi:F-type H+-transporting ATPase subunit a